MMMDAASRATELREDIAPPALAASSIALQDTALLEINVWLLETEQPGHRFETWPEAVRTQVERVLADWHGRHPAATIVAITTAIVPVPKRRDGRNAVVLVHYRAKGGA